MASATLLVIGGTGFFGKSFLDARRRGLLAAWDVSRLVVVARRTAVLRECFPELLDEGVELVDADAGTASDLPAADYVIHAASSTDAQRYATYPAEERANILAAIDNYCRVAERAHRDAQIVYCSSGAVYGQQPPGLERVDEAFEPGEAAGLVAYKRDYAEAKRLAERRVAELGGAGLRVSVARCFAFAGAYLPRDGHFAVGNFLADGLAGRPVTVKATKAVIRSYMHADDLVEWLMAIAAGATDACPVFNVGSEEAVTMGDLATRVAARFGVPAHVPEITDPAVDRYVPSTERAERMLGVRLRFGLDAALDDLAGRLGGAR